MVRHGLPWTAWRKHDNCLIKPSEPPTHTHAHTKQFFWTRPFPLGMDSLTCGHFFFLELRLSEPLIPLIEQAYAQASKTDKHTQTKEQTHIDKADPQAFTQASKPTYGHTVFSTSQEKDMHVSDQASTTRFISGPQSTFPFDFPTQLPHHSPNHTHTSRMSPLFNLGGCRIGIVKWNLATRPPRRDPPTKKTVCFHTGVST